MVNRLVEVDITGRSDGEIPSWDATAGIHVYGAAGAVPGIKLVEQHTASTSATLDFTTAITSAYDEYIFELIQVVPASNNVTLELRASTNGGSSYDTSGIYDYTSGYVYSGAVGVGSSATNAGAYLLMDSISNSANYGLVGYIRLFNPGGSGYKQILGQIMRFDQGGTLGLVALTVLGVYKSATAVNAVRFIQGSGNIASGTIRCYGVAK